MLNLILFSSQFFYISKKYFSIINFHKLYKSTTKYKTLFFLNLKSYYLSISATQSNPRMSSKPFQLFHN